MKNVDRGVFECSTEKLGYTFSLNKCFLRYSENEIRKISIVKEIKKLIRFCTVKLL